LDQAFFDAVKIDAADVIVRGLENTEHFSKYGVRKPVFLTRSRGREVVASGKGIWSGKIGHQSDSAGMQHAAALRQGRTGCTGCRCSISYEIDYVFSAVVKKNMKALCNRKQVTR